MGTFENAEKPSFIACRTSSKDHHPTRLAKDERTLFVPFVGRTPRVAQEEDLESIFIVDATNKCNQLAAVEAPSRLPNLRNLEFRAFDVEGLTS